MNTPKKVALLGFDCAITPLLRKHIEEGICPNFKKIVDNGVVAENCLCAYPSITPPNWTTMATGAWPGTHGVTDFWRHVPGTSPVNTNTHNSFNWDYVRAESFFEAAEKVGKKSVVFNFPSSYNLHKKLKNGVVVGGAALTVGVFMDQMVVANMKGKEMSNSDMNFFTFSDDIMVSTDVMPGTSVKVQYKKASGWENVDAMGDDPLEATLSIPFAGSIYSTKNATWYLLVRDMHGNGYDTVSLSASKNFKDAFFTLKVGEWSHAYNAMGLLADGKEKELRLKAKLISLDEDGENLRLFISHGINIDGENWCYPQNLAPLFNKGDNITTNNTGMFVLSMGWIDLDMWMELIEFHYEWLADGIEALLKGGDWDIFFCHAHPTDYIYHVLMTDLDPNTTPSKAAYEKAWQCHQRLYKAADKYLGRIMKVLGEETLVTLISDHGATADGPNIDLNLVLQEAGLAVFEKATEMPNFLETLPDNLRPVLEAQFARTMVLEKTRAVPQRVCYVYVNLKGRDPGGIVEPEDYEKTQREICEALMAYVEPGTGKKPFALALPKKEAMLMGLWGDQCGDVVYALWPEFSMQHGPILPTSEYSLGTLKPMCIFYGPGVKKGYSMGRVCNLTDLVPTYCYMTGWPVPKDTEGSVIYQIMEDSSRKPC